MALVGKELDGRFQVRALHARLEVRAQQDRQEEQALARRERGRARQLRASAEPLPPGVLDPIRVKSPVDVRELAETRRKAGTQRFLLAQARDALHLADPGGLGGLRAIPGLVPLREEVLETAVRASHPAAGEIRLDGSAAPRAGQDPQRVAERSSHRHPNMLTAAR
ncbi:MAG TPA: hypothetical protein RMH99_07590 [Sandaracinaceae bacterium LLY-WYZ-13_1]|nr:hypothetical protein [Sandaracinaceae bacterium LLY-WYZ-13_1]